MGINKIKSKKKIKKFLFLTLPIIMIPILVVLIVISLHSNKLVTIPVSYILYGLLPIFIILLIFGIIKREKKNDITKKKKVLKIIWSILIGLYATGCASFLFLLYGPYDGFRNWLITTAMGTMNHQYLCQWFYNEDEINKVLNNNYIKEVDENTDTTLIDMEETVFYENEYERQILERKKTDSYKIINFKVNGQNAYLAAIYDPSKVSIGITKWLGRYGEYVTDMAKDKNAILAINGGGFYDPGNNSNGGTPTGVTISKGKVITNNEYGAYTNSGGLIGITKDNKLVLTRVSCAQEALNQDIRDAVTWGPFLIINGKKSFIKGNGGWGLAARSAIGQRADGIILLLVIDSNYNRTKGASMVDLTDIMYNYGAINASNLDGGTSSVMALPKKAALKYNKDCTDDYCFINDPIDSTLAHQTRGIATSFIVEK